VDSDSGEDVTIGTSLGGGVVAFLEGVLRERKLRGKGMWWGDIVREWFGGLLVSCWVLLVGMKVSRVVWGG
jgi:hypothetical protein